MLRADRNRVRRRPEAEHHLRRAAARQIGRAEVAPDRVDLRLLPGELVEGLDRRAARRLEAQLDGADRQVRLAQLRPGHAQRAHVDRVDGVDAALDEGALAPVDHLPARAQLARQAAELEAPVQESVAQLDAGADAAFGGARERRALAVGRLVLVVVEAEAAHEAADALVAPLDLARQLHGVRVDPGVVVLDAVVAVDREGRAAGGEADQALVRVVEPVAQAVADRVAPAPLEVAAGRRLGLLVGRNRARRRRLLALGARGHEERDRYGGRHETSHDAPLETMKAEGEEPAHGGQGWAGWCSRLHRSFAREAARLMTRCVNTDSL